MTGFNRWLNLVRGNGHFAEAMCFLERRRAIRPVHDASLGGVTMRYQLDPPARDAAEAQMYAGVYREYVTGMFDAGSADSDGAAWVLGGLFAGGVRAYAPTAAEFVTLADTELNFTWDEYRQPFDTFVVAAPENFYTVDVQGIPSTVVGMILRYDRPTMALQVVTATVPCDGGRSQGFVVLGTADRGADTLVEAYIRERAEAVDGRTTAGVLVVHQEVMTDLMRAAMTACMLLANHDRKDLGPLNPEHAAKLQASLAKPKLPETVRRANEAALAAIPLMYTLDSTIFFDPAQPPPRTNERVTDRVHRFLGRRGHFAKLRCGPGGTLRERRWRRPSPPNPAHFSGDLGDTSVTYRRRDTPAE